MKQVTNGVDSQPHDEVLNKGASWSAGEQDRVNLVLKHLIKISGHRDHTLLDICVLSAIQDITQSKNASILEPSTVEGKMFLRPRAALVEGEVRHLVDNYAAGTQPISTWPLLEAGVASRAPTVHETTTDGHHILWLPIWYKDTLMGCLRLQQQDEFTATNLDVLEGMVLVYRNFITLLDHAQRDELTGLLNRKTFSEDLQKMQATEPQVTTIENDKRGAPEAEMSHWLAICDIDHFKHVNDTFGHLYGDEVLILVANFMKNSFRVQDRVFRFGGEEFVVLLRCASLEDTKKTLERFRKKIEAHTFPRVGKITISIGFTKIKNHDSPVVILGHADQALYHAKGNGRNQVCFYDDLIEQGHLKVSATDSDVEFF